MYRLPLAALSLAGLISFAPFAHAQTAAPNAFPRLGGMLIGDPHNYDESAYQQQIARLDLAILGMYNGWQGGQPAMAQAVKQIKARNPAILLGNYTIMTEVVRDPSDTATAYLRDKLASEKGPRKIGDWWAYDRSGQHTDWSGGAFSTWDVNITGWTTADAHGDHWPQWKALADYTLLLADTGFDIWYSDNNFWKPREDDDWNRDGRNDSQDNVTVRNWFRNGQRAYYDRARRLAPKMLLMLNTDSDLDGTVYPPNADHFSQYKNVAGAAFMERTMGESWSVETWGGWQMLMGWYHHLRSNLTARMVLFDIGLSSTKDYQYLRYGLATCLMDDAYFSASTDYNRIIWFDEYNLAGKGTTKWLGRAIDPPQTAQWQRGVYRRRFANGMALVNPKGNGRQTVTIPAGYHRFKGTQAPTINNGLPATAVTLNDRDGILLVKDTSVSRSSAH